MAQTTLLVETKLAVPQIRDEHVIRRDLLRRLDELSRRRLTLIAAPTGYGKTTLLAAWARTSSRPVAWLSLDRDDDDPSRFMTYVVAALLREVPQLKNGRLRTLRPQADPLQSTVPRIVNEVSKLDEQVVIILDDCHAVHAQECRDALAALVRDAPEQLRIILATRTGPPIPVGRLRAGGELGELRTADLRFDREEARELMESLGLALDADSIALLEDSTEGWPAGLYLAALSLRDRDDQRSLVTAFAGSNRHVVDYLAAEVLDALPAETRSFLLRTSILGRLSGPLCDAVLEEHGSGLRLFELERSNLLLSALDDDGAWYRYHRMFAELLQFELVNERPDLIPELHRRAVAWYRAAGNVEEAVAHALSANDIPLASETIAAGYRPFIQFGQYALLQRLLASLPAGTIEQSAPLSYVSAMLAGFLGASEQTIERHLTVVEHSGWKGPLPDGTASVEVAAAFSRAVFLFGDVGRSLEAASRLMELARDDFLFGPIGALSYARALYLNGELAGARAALPQLGRETAFERPTMSVFALALHSLIELEAADVDLALSLARDAHELADELGIPDLPLLGIVFTALGSALARTDDRRHAEAMLERGLDQTSISSGGLPRAHAILALALVRGRNGDRRSARALLVECRGIIESATDPGVLSAKLDVLDRQLSVRTRTDPLHSQLPTERELEILRMLVIGLTQTEIASRLYLSTNTIKTHTRSIYRKLGASSRNEAVIKARELGLV